MTTGNSIEKSGFDWVFDRLIKLSLIRIISFTVI